MRAEIEQFRLERQIQYLLHFTRAENLPSIMANGLVPRSKLNCGNAAGVVNDDLRLDNRQDFNCLSITFPNAPMFHRFKKDHPGAEWPILAVHPQLMAHRKTLFCWHNAASNEITQKCDDDLRTLDAFKGLFEERATSPSRAAQFLKPCDPTNVQAEVMIEGIIPPAAIFCVIFPNVPCQNQYNHVVGDKQSIVSGRRGFYGTRQYYRQWGDGR